MSKEELKQLLALLKKWHDFGDRVVETEVLINAVERLSE